MRENKSIVGCFIIINYKKIDKIIKKHLGQVIIKKKLIGLFIFIDSQSNILLLNFLSSNIYRYYKMFLLN